MKPLYIEKTPALTALYTTYSKEFGADYRFKGEVHDFWELVCVTSGRISVAADSNIFELSAGKAVLHPPMQFHNITVPSDTSAKVTVFTFDGRDIPSVGDCVCEIGDISDVEKLYLLAEKNFNISRGLYIDSQKYEGDEHLVFVKRLELFLVSLRPESKAQPLHSIKAENYSRTVDVMKKHISERLSVGELAALCGMSEINLQKIFSYYAGVGVMSYFNRLKMQYAAEILRDGATVKEAALSVGFDDQNYFSTVFKRVTGSAPSKYR